MRLALAFASVMLVAGCGDHSRPLDVGVPAVLASTPLETSGVRRAQAEALAGLLAGQRPRARRAIRRLRLGLGRLERAARSACRGSLGVDLLGLDTRDRERRQACEALIAIVSINNELEDVLDPEGPAAEQLDALDRLAVMAGRKLGLHLERSPLAQLPLTRLSATDLNIALARGGRARGGASYNTCLARGHHEVVSRQAGVVAHSLALVGGAPMLALRRDCAAATPVCGTDAIALQRLSSEGRVQGSVIETGVAATHWDLGEPLVLRNAPSGAILLYGSDGDQLIQPLGSDLRRQGSARLVLAHARRVVPRRFAVIPHPAWLSVALQGHRVSLIRFGRDHRNPVSRVRLLADDLLGGAFGAPALWGGPGGYAVAVTTLRHLHFARLDAQAAPLGPTRRVALRRGSGLMDPQCSVIARVGRRFYVLTVGRGADDRGAGMLVGFDETGRYVGPAVALDLPFRVARTPAWVCPVWLVPARRHLVVVALEDAVRGVVGRRLMAVEYKRDGRLAASPTVLATVGSVGGVVVSPPGFLVSWTAPQQTNTTPGAPQPIKTSRYKCR
jgi:hypothetical protein